MDLGTDMLTLAQIQEASSFVRSSPDIVRTPLLKHIQNLFIERGEITHQRAEANVEGQRFMDLAKVDLYLKMENMQTAGSFKLRGVINQMRQMRKKYGEGSNLVTMSAGNYGKAFAYCVGKQNIKSMCIMPETAPQNRVAVIEGLGVQVKQVPKSDLESEVALWVKNGYVCCHSFNDADLIAGYTSSCLERVDPVALLLPQSASLTCRSHKEICHQDGGMPYRSCLELLEDLPDPDVIVVGCGGGGFVSGIATAISLSGLSSCRVYAVEPEGAATMYESFRAKRDVVIQSATSVAAGLAPLYAGSLCYKYCSNYVKDVLLVSDHEILEATKKIFDIGIKAEPSGCAALAAVLTGKVPDMDGKKVVVYLTGSNVTCEEMSQYLQQVS